MKVTRENPKIKEGEDIKDDEDDDDEIVEPKNSGSEEDEI